MLDDGLTRLTQFVLSVGKGAIPALLAPAPQEVEAHPRSVYTEGNLPVLGPQLQRYWGPPHL